MQDKDYRKLGLEYPRLKDKENEGFSETGAQMVVCCQRFIQNCGLLTACLIKPHLDIKNEIGKIRNLILALFMVESEVNPCCVCSYLMHKKILAEQNVFGLTCFWDGFV